VPGAPGRGPPPRRLPGRRLRGRPRGGQGPGWAGHHRVAPPGQPGHDGGLHPPEAGLRRADRARPGVAATAPPLDPAPLVRAGPGVRWGACVIDVEAGAVLLDVDAGAVLPTASVGKVLLLVEVARRVHAGELDPAEPLPRTPADAVGDSGLWQHLQVPALPVADLAVLVGAVSDNLATNVLLRRVGLDAVAATAASLGLERTALHDVVRDVRTPVDPPALSSGSADELARLFTRLAAGEVLGPEVSATVNGWLATGTDLSMVAGALGLDPLAHTAADRGVVLRNKTGT